VLERRLVRGGTTHDILRFPSASVAGFIAKPTSFHGIPLLAPWASRLDGAAFTPMAGAVRSTCSPAT
jgi:hypothetical protein